VLERIHLAGVADRQVKTYSGGIRRRLDLAASVVGRPQVLFLDEPTAGLDPASRHHLWPLTRNLAATGTTVLLTTQYLEEADQLADPIAVIDHGRLLTEGTTPQLKDRVGGAVVQLRVPAADRARTLAALRDGNGEGPAVDEHDGSVILPGAGRRQDPDGGAAPPGDRRHHPGGRGAAQAEPRRGVPRTDRPPRHPRHQRQHPRPSRRRRRQRPGPTRGANPMSATTTTTRPLGLGRTVSDIAVIARRDLVRSLRLPDVLVTSSIMPVIFILMFTYVFGGAIQSALPPAAHGRYINWLLPGLLAQLALLSGQSAALRMAEDLATGVIDRRRSLPMASSALPAGRTLADTCGMLRTMALLLAVGLTIGFRWQTSPWRLLAGVAITLGFGHAWSWAMAALGLVVRTPEVVQAASFMGAFPLASTSSMFVPTQTMPGWLQAFAAHQPVTVTTNALRGLILGQGALPPGQTITGQVVLALARSAAITAVFAPLAVRLYRHTVS
jgi:ABC-2 type transport system permease protein/oleandomycin transport system permease protein